MLAAIRERISTLIDDISKLPLGTAMPINYESDLEYARNYLRSLTNPANTLGIDAEMPTSQQNGGRYLEALSEIGVSEADKNKFNAFFNKLPNQHADRSEGIRQMVEHLIQSIDTGKIRGGGKADIHLGNEEDILGDLTSLSGIAEATALWEKINETINKVVKQRDDDARRMQNQINGLDAARQAQIRAEGQEMAEFADATIKTLNEFNHKATCIEIINLLEAFNVNHTRTLAIGATPWSKEKLLLQPLLNRLP